MVVHPSNPAKALTSAQITDIYSGKITNWKDAGSEPGSINVYGREDGSVEEIMDASELPKGAEAEKFLEKLL